MDKVSYRTIFNRKKELRKDGKALIQVELYANGKKKYISTKIYIKVEFWDAKKSEIKTNCPNSINYNKEIKDYLTKLENIEFALIQKGRPFELSTIVDTAKGLKSDSFIDFIKNEISISNVEKSTISNYVDFLNKLKTFKEYKKLEDVLFVNIDYTFLNEFYNFLILTVSHNTVCKLIMIMKKFYNIAINKDLVELSKYPFRKFKINLQVTNRVYLTAEELSLFENLKLENKTLEHTLDKFLFACYVGLRISDVHKLTFEKIQIVDNVQWLSFKMQKTGKTNENVNIPLNYINNKALDILEKYKNNDITSTIFKNVSPSTVKKHMDILKKMVGLENKEITFHTSRHTCATGLINKGLGFEYTKEILGHKDIKTTQIYGKVTKRGLVDALRKLDN